MNTVKTIVQWVLVAVFAIFALLWIPSLASVFFLLGAVILLPIKPLEQLFEKYKLKLAVRIVIAVILFVIGLSAIPGDDLPTAEKDTTQTDNKSNVGQDKNDTRSDDKQDKADTRSDDKQDKADTNSDVSRDKSDTGSDDGRVARHPVFTVEEFGNFREIDTTVFEISDFPPEKLVGRWYEDGLLEGYYLELYGNGTWRYYGAEERNGNYWIHNSLCCLDESEFGVTVCQPIMFYDEDDKAYKISLVVSGPEAFITRTDPEDYMCFWREDSCKHCEDLDTYYEEKYPYMELKGNWYPVGDRSGKYYYKITAAAHWAYIIGHEAEEVGVLEEVSKGSFTSEGGTWGKLKTFKLADDGYMYIDGEAYEKVEQGSTPPSRSLGTFCYDNGDGYTFYEDWTFESVTGSSFDEHGTFMFIGDNILLYDDNGYRLHVFYQDEFMDWDGVLKEEAWRRHMDNLDESNPDLYGEAIYYVIPDQD